jgi:protein-tyrosine phosphatase
MHDCNLVARLRFDTCIDLRLPQEELHEDDWLCELLDLRYHHLPIEVPGEPKLVRLVHEGGSEHYLDLLQYNAARFVRALEIIGDDDNHPLLFHSAAGLERSGVLAALVLACVGVEEDAIVADYARSADGIGHIIDRYRGHKLYGSAAAAAAGHRVDGQVMRGLLAAVGGADGLCDWAIDNGLKDTSLDRLRSALIEP